MWQLKKALHGTLRGSALLFQEYATPAMVKIGFTVACGPQHGWCWHLCTGDDFIAPGETQSLENLDEALEQFFVQKKMPKLGTLEVGGPGEREFTKNSELECGWISLEC